MTVSSVAKHAFGKAAKDNIFGANAAAKARTAEIGAEKVTNATIGAILDEDEKLVCLPTVEKVFRGLKNDLYFSYAPISGVKSFLDLVTEACFGDSKPEGYTAAVATAGGTGALHHAIWNYMSDGDTALTANWYWGPYKVLCRDMNRKLDTFQMLNDDNKSFNLPAMEAKVAEILAKQDSILIILNTPAHNPTGYSLTPDDIENVLNSLKKTIKETGKKVTLLLDVAYIDYAGERQAVRKIFKKIKDLPDNLFVVIAYSLSKGFTMYGQRCGAMIGISSNQQLIREFADVNQYTSRATWSNINHGAQETLAQIYDDPKLLADIQEERNTYYKMIQARGDLFTKEAKECGLPMVPYIAGFFLSIPSKDPVAVCEKLHDDNIFAVPLAAGVRVAVCAIPLKKIKGMAAKIKAAMDAVEK